MTAVKLVAQLAPWTALDRHRSGAGVTPRVVSVLIFADEALWNIDVNESLRLFNGRFAPEAAISSRSRSDQLIRTWMARAALSPSVACWCVGIEQLSVLELAPELDLDVRRQVRHILLHLGDVGL